jgi:hypothetical protein
MCGFNPNQIVPPEQTEGPDLILIKSKCKVAEMEFLNIYLIKDSSLLLHAIPSPFYWRILKKSILLSGFKNITNNCEQKTRVYCE